jgi:hypothetical protein
MSDQKRGGEAQHARPEGPFRRAYAWPILWGPWVTSGIGLALLVFGMAVNSPVPVRVTALGLGPLTIVAGLLLPRIQGALELSATGLKGQLDPIPTALVFGHRAAEIAIAEDEPNREQRAKEAAVQAVLDASLWDELNHAQVRGSFARGVRIQPILDTDVIRDLFPTDPPRRRKPPDEPPDEPPLAAMPS